MSWQSGTKIQVLSPVIRGKKGEHQKIIEDAIKSGFIRARIDGIMTELDNSIKLDKQKKHTIELIIDRIVLKDDCRNRLSDSVETALESVDELAAEGEIAMQGMEEALTKVNQFDIETLNLAIKDLSDVVEPMAKFFNVFNR